MTFSKNSISQNKDFIDGFNQGRYQTLTNIENMIDKWNDEWDNHEIIMSRSQYIKQELQKLKEKK